MRQIDIRVVMIQTGEPRDHTVMITGGSVDHAIGTVMHRVFRAVWIKRTRHTPQTLARVLMVPFFAARIASAYLNHNFLLGWPLLLLVFTVGVSLFGIRVVDQLATDMQGLLSAKFSRFTLVGGHFAKVRIYVVLGFGFLVLVSSFHLHPYVVVDTVGDLVLMMALYALTCGRPHPPAKKKRMPLRERVHLRLPRLAGAGV